MLQILCAGKTLATRCKLADGPVSRLVGLLDQKSLKPGEALLLDPCNQIHTLFMRFSIDAVFLNKRDEVIGLGEYRPWRLSKMFFKATKVLELPLGTIKAHNLTIGQHLEISPCSS